ncbi:MAG TPA: glycosyltransferase family 9 protein [Fimbriimonadaceae bacterium]|nr:glycosyltransferase family 9 protein [Fimbriimonadaceae bacterium]
MPPERLLIWLKPQYLGDAVMAAPLLDATASDRPLVLAGPAVQQVLSHHRDAVEFTDAGRLRGLEVLRQGLHLRRQRFGRVLLVNRSFRSALATRIAGIPIRVGHATEGRDLLLSHRVPYPADRYEAECYLDLWRALGHEAPEARPALELTPEERLRGQELAGGATVGIQPGARYAEKQYPLAKLAAVVQALVDDSQRIALLGGPDEVEASRQFQKMLDVPVVDLVGRCSIRETMASLATLRLMLGSDTGVMHLAVGVGCATVTIFGPNPAAKWGHPFAPHRVFEAPKGDPARLPESAVLEGARSLLSRF